MNRNLTFSLFAIMTALPLFSNPIEVGADAPVLTVTTHNGEKLDLLTHILRWIQFRRRIDNAGSSSSLPEERKSRSQASNPGTVGLNDNLEGHDLVARRKNGNPLAVPYRI